MDKEQLRALREGRYAYGSAWKATGRLNRYQNGLNLEVKKAKPPFQYENECYQMLLRKFSGRSNFIIGSYLTDFLFHRVSERLTVTRPDAMIFQLNGTMKLVGLAEFRTGAVLADKKLSGFADFVQRLRDDQGYLPRTLSELAAPQQRLPLSWEIPEDNEQIKIHFFTAQSDSAGEIYSAATQFQVSHRFVPHANGR